MKQLIFIFLFSINTIWGQIDTTFFSLRGYEDMNGNTQLYYMHSTAFYLFNWEDSIYHFNTIDNSEALFLYDYLNNDPYNQWGYTVYDFEFLNDSLNSFIAVGAALFGFEPVALSFSNRYILPKGAWVGFFNNIEFFHGGTNPTFLIGSQVMGYFGIYRYDSILQRYNTLPATDHMDLASISPQNIVYANKPEGSTNYLYRSIDSCGSFELVDSFALNFSRDLEKIFAYDKDNKHIYRLSVDKLNNQYYLRRSNNNGEAYSWHTIYSSNSKFFVITDSLNSGEIFIADRNKILYSNDFGITFNQYLKIDEKIRGIYKKPGTDKFYVITQFNLYEIENKIIKTLKHFIPSGKLQLYPLQVGNVWIYNRKNCIIPDSYCNESLIRRSVTNKVIKPNGKEYYKIETENLTNNSLEINYERWDTLSLKIYQYDSTKLNESEFHLDDLSTEYSDTSFTGRFQFYADQMPVVLENISSLQLFGEDRYIEHLKVDDGMLFADYFFVEGIGINEIQSVLEWGLTYDSLKGCIINGEVFGDTTLVGIYDYLTQVNKFELSQNYPNPFNGFTNIRYQVKNANEHTIINVYNTLGQKVAELVNEYQPPGEYEVKFDGSDLASGVYIYKLSAGEFIQTRKMVLLK